MYTIVLHSTYRERQQLLIGLLSADSSIPQLLNAVGVSLEAAIAEVERLIGRGAGFVAVEIPFTPRARRAIETAIATAQKQGVPIKVEPENLLLGIVDLDTKQALALKVLKNLGVSIPQLRETTLAQIQTLLREPDPQQVRV